MTDWKANINYKRSGAVYFLTQPSRPKFNKSEYIHSRGVTREDSGVILREWNRWIQDLLKSEYPIVREAAKAAGLMKATDLDEFYEQRIVAERKVDVLQSSSKQLKDADHILTQQLRGDQEGESLSTSSVNIPLRSQKRRLDKSQFDSSEDGSSTGKRHMCQNAASSSSEETVNNEISEQDEPQSNHEYSTSPIYIELKDFLSESPGNIGPITFFNTYALESRYEKTVWNSIYVSLFYQALKSPDPDFQQAGQRMREQWESERLEVESYWQTLEQSRNAQPENPKAQFDQAKGKTHQLLGPNLPSESSDSNFIGSETDTGRSSIGSIDIRFMNRLVGPGETSSKLFTDCQLQVGEENVSKLIMDARKDNVIHQSRLLNTSELLSLNFIFDENFLSAHLTPELRAAFKGFELGPFDSQEATVLSHAAMFAASNGYLSTKKFVRSTESETIMKDILMEMTSTPTLFLPRSVLPLNEDSYIHHGVRAIIVGTFGDIEMIHHWTRDQLPTPPGYEESYQPDFYGERSGFPFIIAEVKKPEADLRSLNNDIRKLPHMMKIALDRMLAANIKSPIVLGLLIQERRCEITTMTLQYEALYIYQSLGSFEIPQDQKQLGLFLASIGILKCAKRIATETLASIVHRPAINQPYINALARPSFYLEGVEVPAALPPVVNL